MTAVPKAPGVRIIRSVVLLTLALGAAMLSPGAALGGATFTVNSAKDSGDSNLADGVCDDGTGMCTLRAAIEQANNVATNSGPDTIDIGIGAGPQIIILTQELPPITDPVTIDGTTQICSSHPCVELDGRNLNVGIPYGLRIEAGGSRSSIRGLVINRFGLASPLGFGGGIWLNADANTIEDNRIGTDVGGNISLGSTMRGISILSAGNTIRSNLISGSSERGVLIFGDRNVVAGNRIGTNAAGTGAVGNDEGVEIQDGSGNVIGGLSAADRNVISGNVTGVEITGSGSISNVVEGNYIGVNAAGTGKLSNGDNGVFIDGGASGNTVGGTGAGARNVISGNEGAGVRIEDSNGNEVQGNYVGTNKYGSAALGNSLEGVLIADATNNVVGGTQPGARNVLSGNLLGVGISGATATGNIVEGNYVGISATGGSAIPNTDRGVQLVAPGNTVGGTTAGARNVISANRAGGVFIFSDIAAGNLVKGNFIGTNPSGSAVLGDQGTGVEIQNAPGNTIGGSPEGRNIISGSDGSGVRIMGASAAGNLVQSNYIGTDVTGSQDLGNSSSGVWAENSGPNVIGGQTPELGNRIAFNGGNGVTVVITAGPSILKGIYENSIFSNGGLGIDLGNDGVTENDTGDPDFGPNELQNFPVLADATSDGQNTYIGSVSLNSTPNSSFRIEFFANEACDPSGNGEGQTFLGWVQADSDGSGDIVPFNISFGGVSVPDGWGLTATATDQTGNTSEFSDCARVAGPATPTPTPSPTATPPGPTPTSTPSPTPAATGTASPTPTATPPAGIVGDVDCNGRVDAVDALFVLRRVASLQPFAACINMGDVNCNGGYDAVDALFILRYVAALPNNLPPGCPPIGPGPAVYTVNSTADPGSGVCDATECTLQDALAAAIAHQGPATIAFNIPKSDPGYNAALGVWTIKPTATWYSVAAGITIDGTTQTANQGDTNPYGPEIEVDGSGYPDSHVDCFSLNGNDVLRGLVINHCGRMAVFVSGSGNVVAGNYISTDATGTQAQPYAVDGFQREGVYITGDNNLIGGTTAADRNVISGTSGNGIDIFEATAHDNHVVGNYIGTDRTGSAALPNRYVGLMVGAGAHNNLIGPNNRVAFNGDGGIVISNSVTTGNTITRNSIHHNLLSGIYESQGGNLELAPPVITSAVGPVTGTACAGCTVEVFSDQADQGAIYEGSAMADGSGNWSLNVTPTGPNVTATATDAQGNTSEFSAPVARP